MGIGGISIWQLVIMLFGSKRLKGLGSDLGDAIKGFRKPMGNDAKAVIEENLVQTITVDARKFEEPARKD